MSFHALAFKETLLLKRILMLIEANFNQYIIYAIMFVMKTTNFINFIR